MHEFYEEDSDPNALSTADDIVDIVAETVCLVTDLNLANVAMSKQPLVLRLDV